MKKTLKQKIDELAEIGYEVDIIHNRPYKWEIQPDGTFGTKLVHPRGGDTCAKILNDGNVISEGWAFCSHQDNYNRRIGASIALGRAEKNLKK